MRATARAVQELEQNAPLSIDEQNTIVWAFKSEYVPQIKCWALVGDGKRRRRLMSFLKGQEGKSQFRPGTSMSMKRPDLVMSMAGCRIDLNQSFAGRPQSRRINRERFASKGVGLVMSEEPPPLRTRSTKQEETSLAKFTLRKLMKPEAAAKLLSCADSYNALLQQLIQWVERKNTSAFPIDGLREHPTLSPVQERGMNSRTNRADHLIRQQGPPLPYRCVSRCVEKTRPWKTPKTAYSDFFEDDGRLSDSWIPNPFPPLESSQPFCRFPPAGEQIRSRA